jgi:hypothetical protein
VVTVSAPIEALEPITIEPPANIETEAFATVTEAADVPRRQRLYQVVDLPDACPRCKRHRFIDFAITGGRIRRDCAFCRRTAGFPVWHGDPVPEGWADAFGFTWDDPKPTRRWKFDRQHKALNPDEDTEQ